ncbi:type VI secretion system lipoprotein TssJ [Azospirillum picis]|uniref:Type VI secretion system protein VasD n=1 Tax=Azospirillum picis TaxID=488438 RepID=A0ABU0MFM0_9PROT|nr:type VI secretion system lipoprotein TssJ [Azospirillum picis]MBP2298734.1 type VI secretion system protein VasD [Azospirillum picis]MDQ0532217.1 type VI secretion system protein VasD [Azospirillum picis]
MLRTAGRTRTRISLAAGLAAATALAACSSAPPPPPPPTTISLTVVGSADLNPDPSGRPSPLMLRLYQLGPSDAFANADFFQIIDQDKATLGPTMLDRQELAVAPGGRQTVTVEPKPDARMLAVAAGYRAYEEAGWRAMVPVEPNRKNEFLLTAAAGKVTLAARGGEEAHQTEADKTEAGEPEAGKANPDKAKPDGAPIPAKPDGAPIPAKPAAALPPADPAPAATHNLIMKGPS